MKRSSFFDALGCAVLLCGALGVIASCPDAEYVPVGEVIRELWGKAFGKPADSGWNK